MITINHYWLFHHMLWPSSEYIKQTETREQEACTLSSSSLYTDWLRGSQMTSLIIVNKWPLIFIPVSLLPCCLSSVLCSIRRFQQQSMVRHWSCSSAPLGSGDRDHWSSGQHHHPVDQGSHAHLPPEPKWADEQDCCWKRLTKQSRRQTTRQQ